MSDLTVGHSKFTPFEPMRTWPAMTLREWYAGLCLQGLLSDPSRSATAKEFAWEAVSHADALIKELEKK